MLESTKRENEVQSTPTTWRISAYARNVIGNAKIANFMVELRCENYTVFQVHIFMPILFPDVTGIPA